MTNIQKLKLVLGTYTLVAFIKIYVICAFATLVYLSNKDSSDEQIYPAVNEAIQNCLNEE